MARKWRSDLAACAVTLLLGACTSPAGSPAPGGTAPGEAGRTAGGTATPGIVASPPSSPPPRVATPETPSEADAAILAFGNICSSLSFEQVAQEATRYGFTRVQAGALPPAMRSRLEQQDGTMFLRPGASRPAMLVWNPQPQCDLFVPDVTPAAAETAFRRLIQVLEASPNLTIVNATPEQVQRMSSRDGWQVRHLVLIGPRAMLPVPQKVMSLRVATENAGPLRIMLTIRFAGPPPAGADPALTIPPPARTL